MQAQFITNRDIPIAESSSTTTGQVAVFYLSANIVSPGFTYFNSDATGTASALESLEPRNWDFMTNLYKRARLIGMSHTIEVSFNANSALAQEEFYLCTWYSSDLDTTNPIIRLAGAALGTGQPWSGADDYRDILLSSRRVTKHMLRGPAMTGGRTSHKFTFSLGNQLKDRYGNIAVGGRHIRNVTNNPGGVLHTTDKDVASALTQNWGVDNAINVALMSVNKVSLNHPSSLRITSRPTVLFYDRKLEAQIAP